MNSCPCIQVWPNQTVACLCGICTAHAFPVSIQAFTFPIAFWGLYVNTHHICVCTNTGLKNCICFPRDSKWLICPWLISPWLISPWLICLWLPDSHSSRLWSSQQVPAAVRMHFFTFSVLAFFFSSVADSAGWGTQGRWVMVMYQYTSAHIHKM